jgi:dipeptidyl aminopeptidase/acylaminoacyl peptidase
MREFLLSISPLTHVDRIRAPLFVIQGANDPRVPRSEAEQILKAVRANGREAWFMLATDEGHGFRKKANRDRMNEAVIQFLDMHLLPATP